ncbi:HPr kinase/phosphorylase [Aliiroseovarius sp. 2305UL8-7]|uniref:HPr kinase/phosphorylase n=1 Tax=Aliiroseovarius conchicola TaxID=3121637 RepID=UPI003527CA63
MIDAQNTAASESFHATTVAVDDAAVMIMGPSGSGKSALALQLIGMGARLVADDHTRVNVRDGKAEVLAPKRLQGVIEARGIGLINVPWKPSATLQLVVDMGQVETDRLPPSQRITTVVGLDIALVLRVDAPYFASAVFHLLRHGRAAVTD